MIRAGDDAKASDEVCTAGGAAQMIVDLLDTSTTAVNKKLDELREKAGVVTMGRVGTLIIKSDSETLLEESIEAANAASHEHPSRVIAVTAGDADAAESRLDAQVRVGGDAGAGEVVVLRLSGPLAGHADSVVMPFLLPDIPVMAWWPDIAPAVPAQDPLGKLAIRRITDATNGDDPLSAIKSRLPGYTAGDTDLAWARITYWRALLTSAVDQEPHEPINSALVSGLTDRARARRHGGLAGQPDRRAGAPGGRRAQGRAGAQSRDHQPEPAAGGHHGHPEPDGPARCPGSVGAQGNP